MVVVVVLSPESVMLVFEEGWRWRDGGGRGSGGLRAAGAVAGIEAMAALDCRGASTVPCSRAAGLGGESGGGSKM
jgi:hypothetical protein